MSSPKVSVITLTYNHEDYIGECIGSVLNQTFDDWEMIIIDDGSTDGTPDVISKISDERIRYFYQENIGAERLSENYNKGLDISEGEYIAILDGDDYWVKPQKLQRQVGMLDDNKDAILAYGKDILVDENGKWPHLLVKEDLTKDIYQNRPVGRILEKLLFKNFIYSPTCMYRRNALEKIGGFQNPPGMPPDYLTYLKLALVGEFSATNEILAHHRWHSGQVTRMIHPVDHQIATINFIDNFFQRIPSEIKNELSFGIETLRASYRRRMMQFYLDKGRKHLLNEEWKGAIEAFEKVIRGGSPREKLTALLGIVLSYSKKDMEPLIRIRGCPTLKRPR